MLKGWSGPVARGVIGKMLFDHPRTKGNRSQHRGMTMCMVRKTQHHLREHGVIGIQHAQINVVKIDRAGGVIGIALQQHHLRIDRQKRMHCAAARPQYQLRLMKR